MAIVTMLASRNALRNRRKTLLTGLTVMFGTALLTIALSLIAGLFQTIVADSTKQSGHVRIMTAEYAKREALSPLYANIADVAPVTEMLQSVEGVEGVYPRIQMGMMASEGGDIGNLRSLMVGSSPEYFSEVLNLDERIAEGSYFTGAKDEALLGRSLAKQMGVGPGDEAIFLGRTQSDAPAPLKVTVAGIVDTGVGAFDKQVYVAFDEAQWTADIPDGALDVLLFLDNPDASAEVASAVGPLLPKVGAGDSPELVAVAWTERSEIVSILDILDKIGKILTTVIVLVTAIGVFNTTMMSVTERTGEIGVLRALGLRTGKVVFLFVGEALMIAGVGGTIGALVGSGIALMLQQRGIDLGGIANNMPSGLAVNRTLHLLWSPRNAGAAAALGFIVAIIGAALPALRASKIQPVDAMRR